MKRLELGDEYESSQSEEEVDSKEESDSYGESTDENMINEASNEGEEADIGQTFPGQQECISPGVISLKSIKSLKSKGSKKNRTSLNGSTMGMMEEPFNALRFIALHLKELKEQERIKERE